MPVSKITFTRYLYEKTQVIWSLEKSMLDGQREEALFWTYELYHSGFQEDMWELTKGIYAKHYECENPHFRKFMETTYAEWKRSKDACLLGTIVGTLAMWSVITKPPPRFIHLYREDRHQTISENIVSNYRYLERVSKYAIRQFEGNDEADLARYFAILNNAYLGGNWLYYCSDTPIWRIRIDSWRGTICDDSKTVVFKSDDDLEAFYEMWGLEPEEHTLEMHAIHGLY